MPLTAKGNEIKSAMTKEYGPKKGEQVFYASKNAGKISGVDGGPGSGPHEGGAPVRDEEMSDMSAMDWEDESVAKDAEKIGLEFEKLKGEQTPESKRKLSDMFKDGKSNDSEGTPAKDTKGRWGGRAADCYAKDALTDSILDKKEKEQETAHKMAPKLGRWGGRAP